MAEPVDEVRPRSVRPAHAARLIGCARSTIYELLDQAELASFRIGTARYVTVDSIDQFIARALEAEQPPAA